MVIDSSALLAILFREPEAQAFDEIVSASPGRMLSAASPLEASTVVAGRSRVGLPWTRLDAYVATTAIQVVPHDRDLAILARDAFLRHGKGRHPARPNMGDRASDALAKSCALPLLFKDDDFTRTDLLPAA